MSHAGMPMLLPMGAPKNGLLDRHLLTMSASCPLTLEARAAAIDEFERQFHLQRQGRNDKFASMGFPHEDRLTMEANADDEVGDDDDDYDNESNGDDGTQANDATNAIDMSAEMQVDANQAASSNNPSMS